MAIDIRHDWQLGEIEEIYSHSFPDLIYRAQQVHRKSFPADEIQLSALLNIKDGKCPEDCAYCPQSAHYPTGVKLGRLMSVNEVLPIAKQAKERGATRFCMAAAWRGPTERDLLSLVEIIQAVKDLGFEVCASLGLLSLEQAQRLKAAGLDFYNHNLDTSPEYYSKIISTRTYEDRLATLKVVYEAGMKVCCGGIVGLGESLPERLGLLRQLANLPTHPESVPINLLIPIPGTPLAEQPPVDPIDFVRMVATARILMPYARIRLSAGRNEMSETLQALCFLAGANSIHFGEKLLITPLPVYQQDLAFLERLGMKAVF